MEQTIPLSVLLTREEYSAFVAQKRRIQRRGRFPVAMYLGDLLVVAALAGLFFGEPLGFSAAAAGCLLVIGAFLVVYDIAIAPMLDKWTAAREYDGKESLRTVGVYTFTETTVTLRNNRVEGTLPLAQMTGWLQTPEFFTLSFGREMTLFLPKRLLDEGQCATLTQWFTAART